MVLTILFLSILSSFGKTAFLDVFFLLKILMCIYFFLSWFDLNLDSNKLGNMLYCLIINVIMDIIYVDIFIDVNKLNNLRCFLKIRI